MDYMSECRQLLTSAKARREQGKIVEIKINDLNGRLVQTVKVQQNFINVRNLTTGLYLISVKTNTGNSYCEKLSVVK